jgi:hypothetical protein
MPAAECELVDLPSFSVLAARRVERVEVFFQPRTDP